MTGEDGVPECSVKALLDAIDRGSLPMDNTPGGWKSDANLAILYPGGRIGCRDDWAGILGRYRPGLSV